ncbi:hypothetical protein H6F90_02955 [Trichocoleus sp. FACHB-591]|uniref:hypothetical protein n=1 Tax=Trichocoleus sp. FACHB-591 TaxID=2692872 RepID=UPI001685298B|nr:hypothetical protein [Trichocoleus sp. FACHB-591]MBD2094110.1 hypothetical protein [Trichocoleus sp. FACHB-591]
MNLAANISQFLRSQPGKQFRPSDLRSQPEFASFSEKTISDTLRRLAQGAKIQRRNLVRQAITNKKDWVYWS